MAGITGITGIAGGIEAECPAVLAAAGDRPADVRARVGVALGRLGWEVFPADDEWALDWLPGSRTPAKVSDRRGPSETTMAVTATAQTAVAAADNHSVGG